MLATALWGWGMGLTLAGVMEKRDLPAALLGLALLGASVVAQAVWHLRQRQDGGK